MQRKIIHVDMDAFYASIEERDNPVLRHVPLAVGGTEARGVVSTANYEARRYGVHSAMSTARALQICPTLRLVKPRFDVYKEVSRQVSDILHDYTDLVEPLSLDEAYLDVTENHRHMPSATLLAREIKERIKAVTGLTASAGVSYNKFLAKVASDYRKPDGLFVVKPSEAEAFVESLKIEQFWGVGRITAQKMHEMGIYTGADLKKLSRAELVARFGKAGLSYYQNARAIDLRPVMPYRERKSMGAERTFSTDTADERLLHEEIRDLATEVMARVNRKAFRGRTVTLKVKFANFRQITRSHSCTHVVTEEAELARIAIDLLSEANPKDEEIRLLGISISRTSDLLRAPDGQLEIDFNYEEE